MSTPVKRHSPKTASIFLRWCHKDQALKDALVAQLEDELAILDGLTISWWQDSHLTCGERFLPEILDRLDECDYGLLLLSSAYLRSAFIAKYELPRFVGPSADKGALPVALGLLPPLDGTRTYRGIEEHQIHRLDGRSCSQLRGRRAEFAQTLATEIRRRVLGLGGYRTL